MYVPQREMVNSMDTTRLTNDQVVMISELNDLGSTKGYEIFNYKEFPVDDWVDPPPVTGHPRPSNRKRKIKAKRLARRHNRRLK